MSISLCTLGSGSAGNSTLIIFGDTSTPQYVLIDAGFSPRMTAKRLKPLGIELDNLSHILVTHFDTDHFYPGWLRVIDKHNIHVHAHRRHRRVAFQLGLSAKTTTLFDEEFSINDEVLIESTLFPHDDLGSVGFVIEHDGYRVGYATDLGRPTSELFSLFTDLNVLAIESNYDRQLELSSDRPQFVKRRVMNGNGHLSNEQSLDAVLHIAQQSNLSHVIALHLSRQCNKPEIVRELYAKAAPGLCDRLTIANQVIPTLVLNCHAQREALLF